jgi:hypothetical protein
VSEAVEWVVGTHDGAGKLQTVSDGAQCVFGLTTAEKLAHRLGKLYGVYHVQSGLTPDECEQIMSARDKIRAKHGPLMFGSEWRPPRE